jgi:hypothetical protein
MSGNSADLEQFTYCRERYWLVGTRKLLPKRVIRGHESAKFAVGQLQRRSCWQVQCPDCVRLLQEGQSTVFVADSHGMRIGASHRSRPVAAFQVSATAYLRDQFCWVLIRLQSNDADRRPAQACFP